MSSAPLAIASNATVMGNPTTEGGDMVVLQEGANGWTCYPDRAVSPGNDPSCNNPAMDAAFAAMDDAKVTKPGLGYMLQGGSDESNLDIHAIGPAASEDWITTPPPSCSWRQAASTRSSLPPITFPATRTSCSTAHPSSTL